MKNINVLITGGAGYVGSVVSHYLLNKGYNVTVLDNFFYAQNSMSMHCNFKNFNLVKGDVRNSNLLKSLCAKSDVILPLAAIVGAPACDLDKKLSTEINYEQIKNILKNLSSDQYLILPVSNSGYGKSTDNKPLDEKSPLNPISHYGKTKVKAENLILEKNNTTSLRLATVFGPSYRMRTDLLVNDFTMKAVVDKYIVLFEPNFKRNYIHINDIAILIEKMISKQNLYTNNIFNVGLSKANLSKIELCKEIKKHIPEFNIEINNFTKDKDQRDYIISNKKLESKGWRPKYTLNDGIEALIKLYSFMTINKFNNLK